MWCTLAFDWDRTDANNRICHLSNQQEPTERLVTAGVDRCHRSHRPGSLRSLSPRSGGVLSCGLSSEVSSDRPVPGLSCKGLSGNGCKRSESLGSRRGGDRGELGESPNWRSHRQFMLQGFKKEYKSHIGKTAWGDSETTPEKDPPCFGGLLLF